MKKTSLLVMCICTMLFVSFIVKAQAENNVQANLDIIKKSVVQIVIIPSNDSNKMKVYGEWAKRSKTSKEHTKKIIAYITTKGFVFGSGVIVSTSDNGTYIATEVKDKDEIEFLAKNDIAYIKGNKNSGLEHLESFDVVPTKQKSITLLKLRLVKKGLPQATIGDISKYKEGAEGKDIFGIGFPKEKISNETFDSQVTVNKGSISSGIKDTGILHEGRLQTNLIVNEGMYGGALSNENGHLIGLLNNPAKNVGGTIIEQLLDVISGKATTPAGTALAIPVDRLKEELDTLNIKYSSPQTPPEKPGNTGAGVSAGTGTGTGTGGTAGSTGTGNSLLIIGGVIGLLAIGGILYAFVFKKKGAAAGCLVEDLKSTNGSYLNNVKLVPNTPMKAAMGDTIRLCSQGPEFTVVSEGAEIKIKCLKGDNAGKTFAIKPGGIVIGRSNADIVETMELVSEAHLRVKIA